MIRRLSCLLCLSLWSLANHCQAEDAVRYIQPLAITGSSGAVVVNDIALAQTTQLYPIDNDGQLVGRGDPEKQTAQLLFILKDVLASSAFDNAKVVKLNVYVANDELVPIVQQTLAKQFSGTAKPAVSCVVTTFPISDVLVALDGIAVSPNYSVTTKVFTPSLKKYAALRKTISNFPRMTNLPIGSRIYISGQAEKAQTLGDATRLTLLSLEASLKFCGRTKSDIAQVKCFLTPMKQVADVDRELQSFFAPLEVPAVSYVEWESTLPIEIEVVAFGGKSDSVPDQQIEFLTPPGMSASPVFSRIVRIHHPTTIFIGGLNGESGAGGAAQVEQVFEKLGALLKEAGSDFQHLAKATYYVSTAEPSAKLNELRPKFYQPQSPPAASKAQVRGVGKTGVGLTLDMIAIPAK